mgnify:CR=1 FL=1
MNAALGKWDSLRPNGGSEVHEDFAELVAN